MDLLAIPLESPRTPAQAWPGPHPGRRRMRSTTHKAAAKKQRGHEAAEGTIDQRLVRMMAHPVRFKLLVAFNEGVASPVELARRFNVSVGVVSHHVRVLLENDMIELVDRKQRRGAIEHFYRAVQRPWFTSEDWERIPAAVRNTMLNDVLAEIARRVVNAADAAGFDRPDIHVSYTELHLDEEGFKQVGSIWAQALQDALDVEAECAGRRGQADETITSQAILMHFESV